MKNLVLNDDVVTAVSEGMFHIWPIRTVDEGISILTGVPAGECGKDAVYPEDTVNGRVCRKLLRFAETVARFRLAG